MSNEIERDVVGDAAKKLWKLRESEGRHMSLPVALGYQVNKDVREDLIGLGKLLPNGAGPKEIFKIKPTEFRTCIGTALLANTVITIEESLKTQQVEYGTFESGFQSAVVGTDFDGVKYKREDDPSISFEQWRGLLTVLKDDPSFSTLFEDRSYMPEPLNKLIDSVRYYESGYSFYVTSLVLQYFFNSAKNLVAKPQGGALVAN